jgi:hypothetical protein
VIVTVEGGAAVLNGSGLKENPVPSIPIPELPPLVTLHLTFISFWGTVVAVVTYPMQASAGT